MVRLIFQRTFETDLSDLKKRHAFKINYKCLAHVKSEKYQSIKSFNTKPGLDRFWNIVRVSPRCDSNREYLFKNFEWENRLFMEGLLKFQTYLPQTIQYSFIIQFYLISLIYVLEITFAKDAAMQNSIYALITI